MMTMGTQKKKKVLFMIDTLGGGGAERVLCHILRDLDRSRFEVNLLLIILDGVYVPDVPADVRCRWIFKSTENMRFTAMKYLYRLYRRTTLELFRIFPSLLSRMSRIQEKYDIGISFCEGHNTPLLFLKKHYFTKTISWIHVDIRTHKANIRPRDLQKCAAGVDRLFFVSEDARKGFLECYPEFKENNKLEVIYNPIDIPLIIRQSALATIEKDKLTLIAIGRLTSQKRFDRLLDVHRLLLDKGVDHQLWILGEGPDKGKLLSQAKQLNLESSCLFLGFQNPYPYLKAADIFVMTSDYEGLPVVVCEAMVLGKPIVSTNVTGPRELLANGRYGALTSTQVDSIAHEIEKMINDPQLRDDFSTRLQLERESFIFSSDLRIIENKLLEV